MEAAPTNHQETHVSITSTGTARMPAIPFHSITLVVAGVAAVVTFGTNWAMLSAPAMFLGWVAYGVTGETVRHRYANLASYVVGLAFGAGTTLVINRLQPSLGLAATGIAIFALVAIVMCLRALPMFNYPPAYFLGITSFFYSGHPPTVATVMVLGTAGAVGATGAALSDYCQSRFLAR